MRILSVGGFSAFGISNTCLHRHWGLEKIASKIDSVDTAKNKVNFGYKLANYLFQKKHLPIRLPDLSDANNQIKNWVLKNEYDVIWIDKGLMINPETLVFVKQKLPNCRIVSFSLDNMSLRHNQSHNYLQSISLYDTVFTNKSYILEEMKLLGAKKIIFINNCYEAKFHYPRILSSEEKEMFGGDVGFIGVWEKERCESILYLVNHGIQVVVYGEGKWNDYNNYSPNLIIKPAVFSEDYNKALQALKISLCFLRKINFDQQTTRTMEIPACGGFMLAERTQEHVELFEEGKEAEFFESDKELLEKCEYYLSHEIERKKIIAGGTNRCSTSGYSNEKTIGKLIKRLTTNEEYN